MSINDQQKVEKLKPEKDPAFICRVPSGWVALCSMQHLRGYSILMPDPAVESINSLDRRKRIEFLSDMALVGDALIEVTGAIRINYAIMGNELPTLHAHIIPRYMSEPDVHRKNVPWSYPGTYIDSHSFNHTRDKELIDTLSIAILSRI